MPAIFLRGRKPRNAVYTTEWFESRPSNPASITDFEHSCAVKKPASPVACTCAETGKPPATSAPISSPVTRSTIGPGFLGIKCFLKDYWIQLLETRPRWLAHKA
jgi:hypothetical protein